MPGSAASVQLARVVAETSPQRIDWCSSKVDVISSPTHTTTASHSHCRTCRTFSLSWMLAPWPALNGYALRVSRLLDHLAQYWSISLIAPPSDAIPSTIVHHVPLTLPAHGVTYPWRFDQTTLRATVDRAVRDHRPIAR